MSTLALAVPVAPSKRAAGFGSPATPAGHPEGDAAGGGRGRRSLRVARRLGPAVSPMRQ